MFIYFIYYLIIKIIVVNAVPTTAPTLNPNTPSISNLVFGYITPVNGGLQPLTPTPSITPTPSAPTAAFADALCWAYAQTTAPGLCYNSSLTFALLADMTRVMTAFGTPTGGPNTLNNNNPTVQCQSGLTSTCVKTYLSISTGNFLSSGGTLLHPLVTTTPSVNYWTGGSDGALSCTDWTVTAPTGTAYYLPLPTSNSWFTDSLSDTCNSFHGFFCMCETHGPTNSPTHTPTNVPTTRTPTNSPTHAPTNIPTTGTPTTGTPTTFPTPQTLNPSMFPSTPTQLPTYSPGSVNIVFSTNATTIPSELGNSTLTNEMCWTYGSSICDSESTTFSYLYYSYRNKSTLAIVGGSSTKLDSTEPVTQCVNGTMSPSCFLELVSTNYTNFISGTTLNHVIYKPTSGVGNDDAIETFDGTFGNNCGDWSSPSGTCCVSYRGQQPWQCQFSGPFCNDMAYPILCICKRSVTSSPTTPTNNPTTPTNNPTTSPSISPTTPGPTFNPGTTYNIVFETPPIFNGSLGNSSVTNALCWNYGTNICNNPKTTFSFLCYSYRNASSIATITGSSTSLISSDPVMQCVNGTLSKGCILQMVSTSFTSFSSGSSLINSIFINLYNYYFATFNANTCSTPFYNCNDWIIGDGSAEGGIESGVLAAFGHGSEDSCAASHSVLCMCEGGNTSTPTQAPSVPTSIPTITPSHVPTITPTNQPTKIPTSPTSHPTSKSPSNSPTKLPTTQTPTKLPSIIPSLSPTLIPTYNIIYLVPVNQSILESPELSNEYCYSNTDGNLCNSELETFSYLNYSYRLISSYGTEFGANNTLINSDPVIQYYPDQFNNLQFGAIVSSNLTNFIQGGNLLNGGIVPFPTEVGVFIQGSLTHNCKDFTNFTAFAYDTSISSTGQTVAWSPNNPPTVVGCANIEQYTMLCICRRENTAAPSKNPTHPSTNPTTQAPTLQPIIPTTNIIYVVNPPSIST